MKAGRLALVGFATLIVALSVLPLAMTATKDQPPHIKVSSAYQPPLEACPSVKQAIGMYRRAYTQSRNAMGLEGAVPRAWYDCRTSRRRALEWRDKAWQAKHAHTLWRTIPASNDWRTSVRLAQRVYPGTSDWLLYISQREGGYGQFVMNHQGSGAGGWMQFMASTFYGYVGSARADLQRRGFLVDPSVWTWTHPMGQALTAAYMRYTGRDGCHWCL